MKKLLSIICITTLVAMQSLIAQTTIPFLTIQQIQSVSGTNLANCNDSSSYTGKVVITRGIVITAPVVSIGGTSTGINAIGSAACDGAFYIQNGTGPWSGILVRQSLTMKNGSTGILSLNVGDSVVVRGTVREYARVASGGNNFPGETHIDLDTTLSYSAAAVNRPVQGPTLINISDLVIGSAGNNIVQGEQWEGVYVQIKNATVSQVPNSTSGTANVPFACVPPSGSRRRRIVVKDKTGNEVVVSDRFLAGRFSNPTTINNNIGDGASLNGVPGAYSPSTIGVPGGTLIYPSLGDFYLTISGVVSHWLNNAGGCSSRIIVNPDYTTGPTSGPVVGSSTASAQGYVIQPFLSSHYVTGSATPIIKNTSTYVDNISVPNPAPGKDIEVRTNITQFKAPVVLGSGTSLILKYTTDAFTSTSPIWNTLNLVSLSGDNFSATIPNSGLTEGTLIRYFIRADVSGSVTTNPDSSFSNFFYVRSNGTTIYDLQYTPYADQNSRFAGPVQTLGTTVVTVSGIVASTYKDLGVVYIQQENVKEWGGIKVYPTDYLNTGTIISLENILKSLERGQKIKVVGKVIENLKETVLVADNVIVENGTGNLVVAKIPALVSIIDKEKYEGVLVRVAELPFNRLKVLNNNVFSNRGTWSIGPDTLNALNSALITTGVQDIRNNTRLFASINTTYLRSKFRGGNDGVISAQYAVLDSLNKKTSLDSLNGLVTFSFDNYLITPRDNDDFYGVINTIKFFNSQADPTLFAASRNSNSVTGEFFHSLNWSVNQNNGADGFILDCGLALTTTVGSPVLANFKDRTYYRIGVFPVSANTYIRSVSSTTGALYRIRGYKKINSTDTIFSNPAVQLLSNIPGTFVVPASTSTGLFQDSYGSETGISVYPNPSSEELNYKILLNSIPNELYISIFDITGKRVSEQVISSPSQEGSIPTNNLIPGVYLAEFRSGGKVISRSRIIRLD